MMSKDRLGMIVSMFIPLVSKRTTLTGDNDEISEVTQTIACPYTGYPFVTGFFDDQVLKFTLRLAQDEFHPGLFA